MTKKKERPYNPAGMPKEVQSTLDVLIERVDLLTERIERYEAAEAVSLDHADRALSYSHQAITATKELAVSVRELAKHYGNFL